MKKRLEADLISIAHRVLKLKNKSEVDQLYLETRKLYEALTVLKFYGDNYEQVKAEISEEDITEKLAIALEEKEVAAEIPTEVKAEKKSKKVVEEPIEEPIAEEKIEVEIEIPEEVLVEEEIVAEEEVLAEETTVEEIVAEEEPIEEETIIEEPIAEEKEEVVAETIEEASPEEEVTNEEIIETAKSEVDTKIEPLNELLEMLSTTKEEKVADTKPEFELTFDSKINEEPADIKVEKTEKPAQVLFDDFLGTNYAEPVFVKPEELEAERKEKEATSKLSEYINKPNLNDKISRGLTIGLNDRVAFMKHLFDDNSEDYNRVLSQLITFDSLQEARDFLDNFVKPDYNDWKGKEEYAERFMEIIEKKFS
ncbi:MAG: hypothetical protein O9267_08815 [Flavobacterium sp.]|uniref:hypothetical protein n=1 Tax=Flavobacterium sp. TaxID=239 RepID=UPI0022BE8415|nr:hypothetical protein [Flavobacterium sp.]MCZ8197694.1 hypothetical protein [Flavobacterium sp.]